MKHLILIAVLTMAAPLAQAGLLCNQIIGGTNTRGASGHILLKGNTISYARGTVSDNDITGEVICAGYTPETLYCHGKWSTGQKIGGRIVASEGNGVRMIISRPASYGGGNIIYRCR